jgi:small-conductance mechanosensitive channel
MLAMRVYSALRQAGIEIPFAQRDLHLRSMSDEVAAALSRRDAPPPASAPGPGAVPQAP